MTPTINADRTAFTTSSGTGIFATDGYGPEQLVETRVLGDTIELIYRREAQCAYYTVYPPVYLPPKVFKRVYKVELIREEQGQYISPAPEYYKFDFDINQLAGGEGI